MPGKVRVMSLCIAVVLSAAAVQALMTAEPTTSPSVSSLKVMSFNVRYGHANDGEDRWERRKTNMTAVIRDVAPDLLGTQETLAFQADHLRGELPGYGFVGVGRGEGLLSDGAAELLARA